MAAYRGVCGEKPAGWGAWAVHGESGAAAAVEEAGGSEAVAAGGGGTGGSPEPAAERCGLGVGCDGE